MDYYNCKLEPFFDVFSAHFEYEENQSSGIGADTGSLTDRHSPHNKTKKTVHQQSVLDIIFGVIKKSFQNRIHLITQICKLSLL